MPFRHFVLFVFAACVMCAQNAVNPKEDVLWHNLNAQVERIASEFDGVMGITIVDLTSGREILLHPDEQFPTASSIKIAVLAELYRQGRLADLYTMRAADVVPG